MKSFSSVVAAVAFASGVIATPVPQAFSYTTPAVDGTYRASVLKHHNLHRANHSSPDVTWGPSMAEWAMDLASQCSFNHNTSIGTKSYGQNIAAGTAPHDISYIISNEFYNGEVNWYAGQYGLANPNFTNFEHYGHFTQVVWAGTTHVGCATYNCTAAGGIKGLEGDNIAPYMTVCNYYPAGNMGGEYGSNIGKPLDEPTIDGSA